MAEAVVGFVGGALVGVAGNAVLAPMIDRFKAGRQISRSRPAVYIPGEGRMIDFDSTEKNRSHYREYLKREKWIVQYLKPVVINLAELASALSATKLLVVEQTALMQIENTVMVLGTTDPSQKLEGIMLAFKDGFLQARTEQLSVPWELLHAANRPVEPWVNDFKLLEI